MSGRCGVPRRRPAQRYAVAISLDSLSSWAGSGSPLRPLPEAAPGSPVRPSRSGCAELTPPLGRRRDHEHLARTTLRPMDGALARPHALAAAGAWLWPAFVALTRARRAWSAHAAPARRTTETLFGRRARSAWSSTCSAVLLLSRPLGRAAAPASAPTSRGSSRATTAARWSCSRVSRRRCWPRGSSTDASIRLRRARDARRDRARPGVDRRPRAGRVPPQRRSTSSTFAIQPGSVYRTCVPSATASRSYCVIVKTAPAVRAQRQVRRLRAKLGLAAGRVVIE